MGNKTIYPYGTGGQLPSSIGIVNDFVTGGVDKALSAEVGKTIGTELYTTGSTESEIDLSQCSRVSAWTGTGYWRLYNVGSSYVIPREESWHSIKVTANEQFEAAVVQLSSPPAPTASDQAMTGYISYHYCAAGGSVVFDLDDTCTYIVVGYTTSVSEASSNNYTPDYIAGVIELDTGDSRIQRLETEVAGIIATGGANSISVKMERGGLLSSGADDYTISSYNTMLRTAMFIHTGGASSVTFPISGTLYQFSSSNTKLSSDSITGGSSVSLSSSCEYIRFETTGTNANDITVSFSGMTSPPKEKKRVQFGSPTDRLVFEVDGDICTTALIMLPPNYTVEGRKVPLVIWDSGDGSFENWTTHTMGDSYAGRVTGLQYLRDQGFAVLEIYSWGSYYYNKYPGCGRRSAMPIPTHIATHEKGVEYVLSRYNIDQDSIFHISKSGSGKMALYYALQKPKFNLKAIYAMAPVFDDLNFPWWSMPDYRAALFEELKMRGEGTTPANQFLNGTPVSDGGYNGQVWAIHSTNGEQFIADNADKFTFAVPGWMNLCGQTISEKIADTRNFSIAFWDGFTMVNNVGVWTDQTKLPATKGDVCYTRDNLVMIGNHIPIKVIMSPTDEQTPYWDADEVVKQLLNGGCDASMHTLETGGHAAPDHGSGSNLVKNITTRLGVSYSEVSIGWVVSCEDIYARFLNAVNQDLAD